MNTKFLYEKKYLLTSSIQQNKSNYTSYLNILSRRGPPLKKLVPPQLIVLQMKELKGDTYD